jgi:hypothetical protein
MRTGARTGLSAALVIGLPASLAWFGGPATASTIGKRVAQDVRIDNYQHYLEDLLYTHLGDDRGYGPEHDLARENIETTMRGFGLAVELEPFEYDTVVYYNVVATQPGAEIPDQIVVVGAHFDSADNPGADDNGTGTALVMEVARVLSKYRSPRTINYVLFDREEQGFVGSWAFVDDHADEDITMALIVDMVGHDSGAYAMEIYGKPASSTVINGVDAAIETYGEELGATPNIGDWPLSDNWPFESAGIPACVIIEDCYTCNPHYQTPRDAVDIEPGYINYLMLEDLLHSVVGYLVDKIGIMIPGDLDGDGIVGINDFLLLLGAWGACPAPCPPFCIADLDGDCEVGITDFLILLANWG